MCERLCDVPQSCEFVVGDDNCGQFRMASCPTPPDSLRIFGVPITSTINLGDGVLVAADQAIVMAADSATPTDMAALAGSVGGTLVGQIPDIGVYQFDVGTATWDDLWDRLTLIETSPLVQGALPNMWGQLGADPQQCPPKSDIDSLTGADRCPYTQIDYSQALTIFDRFRADLKLSGVTVGVIDTGVDTGNPDLDPTKIHGIGDITPEYPPRPEWYYHGTGIASIIAGMDNGSGANGIASRFLKDKLKKLIVMKEKGALYADLHHFERLAKGKVPVVT
jgi:subtilisin family serine protease